jgi:hypothetical protein
MQITQEQLSAAPRAITRSAYAMIYAASLSFRSLRLLSAIRFS